MAEDNPNTRESLLERRRDHYERCNNVPRASRSRDQLWSNTVSRANALSTSLETANTSSTQSNARHGDRLMPLLFRRRTAGGEEPESPALLTRVGRHEDLELPSFEVTAPEEGAGKKLRSILQPEAANEEDPGPSSETLGIKFPSTIFLPDSQYWLSSPYQSAMIHSSSPSLQGDEVPSSYVSDEDLASLDGLSSSPAEHGIISSSLPKQLNREMSTEEQIAMMQEIRERTKESRLDGVRLRRQRTVRFSESTKRGKEKAKAREESQDERQG